MDKQKDAKKRDYELINRIKNGDDQAFEELMKIYHKPVFYTIKRLVGNEQDAEDLTLEVFAKIFFNIDMFTPYSSFSTWLLRVASNYAIDFLRKKRMESVSLIVDNEEEDGKSLIKTLSTEDLNPEENIIKEQNEEQIRMLLDKLPEDVKKILEMRYFENMRYKEISQQLKIPIGTVKARLHRAKKLLNILAKEHFFDKNN